MLEGLKVVMELVTSLGRDAGEGGWVSLFGVAQVCFKGRIEFVQAHPQRVNAQLS